MSDRSGAPRAVFCLLSLYIGLAQAQTGFQSIPANFNPGEGRYGAVSADFNRDGTADLAFVDFATSSETVLLGDGRGGFRPSPASPILKPRASQSFSILSADFNNDGNPDIAIVSFLAGIMQGSFAVFLGDGQGGFTLAAEQTISPTPQGFAAADFNGDGLIDIAVSNALGITVWSGDGTGQFRQGGSIKRANLSGLITGDFNRDGLADLAALDTSRSTVVAFLGGCLGGFCPGVETSSSGSGLPVDVNGDGIPDLVVPGSNTVSILLGDGRGGFSLHATLPYSVTVSSLAAADFNGDGNTDLILKDAILYGDGSGNFTEATRLPGIPNSAVLAVVDVDRDGKPDVVSSAGLVFVNSLKTIAAPQSFTLRASAGQAVSSSVSTGAVSVNGLTARYNQIWLRYSGGQVSVDASGLQAGTYRGTVRLSAPGYFGTSISVNLQVAAPSGTLTAAALNDRRTASPQRLADFNGDGKPDLLGIDANGLEVRLNDGNGSLAAADITSPILEPYIGMVVADFNGDGIMDVALLGPSGVTLYPGIGDGRFEPGRGTGVQGNYNSGNSAVGDFNGDGIPDIVVLLGGQQFLTTLLGDGHGRFTVVRGMAPLQRSGFPQVADFDGDGFDDLLFAELAGENVHLYMGDGTGRFQLRQTIYFGPVSTPGPIAIGDWNGDGHPDIAVVNQGYFRDRLVSVLMWTGAEFGLGVPYQFSNPRITGSLMTADVDGDGSLDLLLGFADDTTGILLGDGAGAFRGPSTLTVPGTVGFTSDLNGDGRPDLLLFANDGRLTTYLGGVITPTLTLTQEQANPFTIGQTVFFTAALAYPAGTLRVPTGTVSLYDGVMLVGTAPLVNGTARFVTPFAARTHTFNAVYNGDARTASVSVPLLVIEAGLPTSIRSLGDTQPLRALVSDANGNPVSGAGVIFAFPDTSPAVAFTGSNGIATSPIATSRRVGDGTVTATVSGYPTLSAVFHPER